MVGKHDDDADPGHLGAVEMSLTKRRISQLRIRETQLQMIVILEVLALQPCINDSRMRDWLASHCSND